MNLQRTLLSRVCHDFASPLSAIMMSVDAFMESKDESFLEHVLLSTRKMTCVLDMYRMLNSGDEISASNWSRVMQDAFRNDNVTLNLHTETLKLSALNAQLLSYCTLFLKRFVPKGGVISVYQTSAMIEATAESDKIMLPNFSLERDDVSSKTVFDALLASVLDDLNVKINLSTSDKKYTLRITS